MKCYENKFEALLWRSELPERNVDITREQDGKGRAPLHLAAEKGVVSIVWPLLSHGASVHARWVGMG